MEDVIEHHARVHHLGGNGCNLLPWNLAAPCQRCHREVQWVVDFYQANLTGLYRGSDTGESLQNKGRPQLALALLGSKQDPASYQQHLSMAPVLHLSGDRARDRQWKVVSRVRDFHQDVRCWGRTYFRMTIAPPAPNANRGTSLLMTIAGWMAWDNCPSPSVQRDGLCKGLSLLG